MSLKFTSEHPKLGQFADFNHFLAEFYHKRHISYRWRYFLTLAQPIFAPLGMENNARGTLYPKSEGTFYVIGLSYLKADAEIRGHFSLDEKAKEALLQDAKESGIQSISILSTCNRTEIYGFADHPYQLIKMLCEHTRGKLEEFEEVAYIYKEKHAVDHLFRVATGLDSQILGDFEIISQLRSAFKRSKKLGLLNAYMERLANSLIQASKRIKNETELSSGTTSVSYAAVRYIMDHYPDAGKRNILLFGTGKIGRNTCENLVKHTRNDHITLINRTLSKAEEVAGKFNLIVRPIASLETEIAKADIIVVATGAQQPTVLPQHLNGDKQRLLLDLSIPRNVAPEVGQLEHADLVHLDQLAQMADSTIRERANHIPDAERIIEAVKSDFNAWASSRRFAPAIAALKNKLSSIKEGEIDNQRRKLQDFDTHQAEIISDRIIHKITTQVVNHLKNSNGSSDTSLEVIRKIFELDTH